MSDFDVDIRAVSSASFGARAAASDASQVATADQSSSAQSNNLQASSTAQLTSGVDAAAGQPQFRYDSFRFIYHADYGRIVLIDQDPQTGKAISQIPSQRALQLYAEQHQSELRASISATSGSGQSSASIDSRTSTGSSRSSGVSGDTGVSSVGSKAPNLAAALPASPAYLSQAYPPVNITI